MLGHLLVVYWLFLWTKSHKWLFLWFLPSVETFLLRCLHHWNYPFHLVWIYPCIHSVRHSSLLHLHPQHHPEDALHWRETQGLLHLHLSPHCSHSLLWNDYLHLCDAQIQLLNWAEQSAVSVLHSVDTHVEPSHLQSEEQRCKGGPEKGKCQNIFLGFVLNISDDL